MSEIGPPGQPAPQAPAPTVEPAQAKPKPTASTAAAIAKPKAAAQPPSQPSEAAKPASAPVKARPVAKTTNDPWDFLDATDILSKLPMDEFNEKLQSPKWQERQEALGLLSTLLEKYEKLD